MSSFSFHAQNFWSEVGLLPLDYHFAPFQMSVLDANTIWVQGLDYSSGVDVPTWCRSLDGGVTWTHGTITLGNPNLTVSCFQALTETTAYVTAFPKAEGFTGGIWVTHDAGATWTQQDPTIFSTPYSFANVIHFWDENKGVAIGDPVDGVFEIYTTTDGGTNWVSTSAVSIPPALCYGPAYNPCNNSELGISANFDVINNRIWFATTSGRLYMSDNFGVSWTAKQSPIPDFGGGMNGSDIGTFCFSTENKGRLIVRNPSNGVGGNYFKTEDGGATWQVIPVSENIRTFAIKDIPGSTEAFYTYGEFLTALDRGISLSIDNGITWSNLNATDSNPIEGGLTEFISPTVGYCISHYSPSGPLAEPSTFFKLNDPLQLLSTAETDTTAEALFAAPNPTADFIKLFGKNIQKVTVTDMQGKLLLKESYAGLDNVSLDLNAFQSGLYLIKVSTTTGKSNTMKIIKK